MIVAISALGFETYSRGLCNKSKIKVNSFLAQNIILNLAQLASSLKLDASYYDEIKIKFGFQFA
jgi:hypothetical protein